MIRRYTNLRLYLHLLLLYEQQLCQATYKLVYDIQITVKNNKNTLFVYYWAMKFRFHTGI